MATENETEKKQSNGEASQKPTKPAVANTVPDAKKPPSGDAESSCTPGKASSAKSISPNDVPVAKMATESSPRDSQKHNTSTPVVSKASKPSVDSAAHSQVEQQLAEMMEIDADDDKDSDSAKDSEQLSNASNASLDDLNDLNDESLVDEMDVSDVSSSIAENENDSKTPSPRKKPKKRQPPIMIGYKKRRKVQSKKLDDESKTESEIGSPVHESVDEKSIDDSKKLDQSASSDDNTSETSSTKSTARSVSMIDKYCWICHRDGLNSHKCIACPRVYHQRCLMLQVEDPNNFHCPECSAILKADNVNTRSPVMQAVNLDQLCTLLKHVIDIIKIQKDAHHFLGPVDTREFPHYREYVVYPMDITTLEKNIKNKVYGCTEAFLADMKWIVHNSVVFNTKAAKITNVAKNLLKTCRREVLEIETCAECYYNLLVRKDTWFIEVCKRPHLLIWARLKGYPPWPAKALKCKDEMVDCRFFGAHDKAWVPLKDCYLYSKVPPQIVKIKPGSNLDEGLQEIEKHINKLKEKYGKFAYADFRMPYNPAEEMKQLQEMLPNFNPSSSPCSATKPTAQTERSNVIAPKSLFSESTTSTPSRPTTPAASINSKSSCSEKESSSAKPEPSSEDPAVAKPTIPTATNDSTGKPAKAPEDESNASVSNDSQASSTGDDESASTNEEESNATIDEPKRADSKMSTASNGTDKARDSTDTEAEESDSSRSTTKSTASSTSQNSEASVKKMVTVKKIETINAVAAPERKVSTPVPIAPKPMPGLVPTTQALSVATAILSSNVVSSTGPTGRKITDKKMETVRCVRPVDDKNKPKSVITVKNFASFEKCDNMMGKSPPSQAPPLAPISSRKEPTKVVAHAPNEHNFSLDNVKDEPVEVDPSPNNEDPIFVKEIPPPTKVPASKPIQTKSTVDAAHRKRSSADDNEPTNDTNKKSKNDSGAGCRTVNITENVTLSLINNQVANVVENVPAAVPNKTQPVLKAKPPPKTYVVAPSVPSSDTQTQTVSHPLPSTISKPIRIAPAPGPAPIATPIRMFTTTAQQQRIVNGNTTINGTAVPSRSNILLVQSPKQPAKATFGQNGSGEIIVQFMSELLNNNRRAMEDALDKIAGKGDLRAKVILLQKEIENMKKSHEVIVEEIKRDYEVQIAELRAASIAQKKYDLAHERLKFEKEKELAVKEAKSKQWCSNCQKSANYYCCWNTAYCDFECQKEHWNQHMHVCKNDVKRKAAECSENEPPRIMMQNDVLNDYQSIMNGYEKINQTTYAYQNSNNSAPSSRSNGGIKIQTKGAANKTVQRPLLPRVTATVTCSPSVFSSSTPVVTATLVDNSYPNVSSSGTPLRSTMIGSMNVHPLIRQAQHQFHK